MWIFTPKGFYSVVIARGDQDELMIRARVKGDLENLRDEHIPDLKIIESKNTDYRYRAIVPRRVWLNTLVELGDELTYSNFKDEVKKRQGADRYHTYTRVWAVMLGLQPKRVWDRLTDRLPWSAEDEDLWQDFEDSLEVDDATGRLPYFGK